MKHLRKSSNYLVPGGFFDKVRIPVSFAGNDYQLFHFFAFVLFVAVEFTEFAYEQLGHYIDITFKTYFFLSTWALFLALVLLFPFKFVLFYKHLTWKRRNRHEHLLTLSFILPLLFIMLIPVSWAVDWVIELNWVQVKAWVFNINPFDAEDYWKWILPSVVIIAFMLAGNISEKIFRWSGKLFLYILGLIGPFILFLLYLLLCMLQIDSPFIDKKFHFQCPFVYLTFIDLCGCEYHIRTWFLSGSSK